MERGKRTGLTVHPLNHVLTCLVLKKTLLVGLHQLQMMQSNKNYINQSVHCLAQSPHDPVISPNPGF